MQKLFDFDEAVKLVEGDERLTRIIKMAKDYDYILEVLDDEPLDPAEFLKYRYQTTQFHDPAIDIISEHGITRSNP